MPFQDEIFPARAIRSNNKSETSLLVGRDDLLLQGLLNIQRPNAVLAITGERGIGKTTVGAQILNALSSQKGNYVHDVLSIEATNIKTGKYECLYVECSKDLLNLNGLIRKIIISKENSDSSEVSLYSIFKKLEAEPKFLKMLQNEIGFNLNKNIDYLNPSDFGDESTLKERFINLLKKINDGKPAGLGEIVIFIDEFERLPDVNGIADFIKQTGLVRFVFIGLPESIEALVNDHKSTKRKIIPVYLDRLSEENIYEYFKRATKRHEMVDLVFDKEFLAKVYAYSDGYPPIMQKFGESVVMEYYLKQVKNKKKKLKASDILKKITEGIIKNEFLLDGKKHRDTLKLIDNSGKEDIIFSLSEMTGLVDIENELRKNIKSQYRFNDNCDELVAGGVLVIKEDTKITFTDPYFRLVTRFYKETGLKIYNFQRKKEG